MELPGELPSICSMELPGELTNGCSMELPVVELP